MRISKELLDANIIPETPFGYITETADETRLIQTIRVLLAAGCITEEDIKHAWILTQY